MNTKQIIIPTIMVIGMMLLTIGTAAALPTDIEGHVHWSNTTPCTDIVELRIINMNTGAEWNQSTPTQVMLLPGSSFYGLTIDDVTDISNGDILQYIATGNTSGGGTETNTSTATWDTTSPFLHNISLDAPASPADLIVESITVNPICKSGGDYWLFANESNEICATIKNNGSTAAQISYACFEINGVPMGGHVQVSSLAPGAEDTVCITDGTIRNHGDVVVINVTADCLDNVTEGTSGELNNESSISETVYNNGYKGKTYTGGSNITTWKDYDLNGNLLYSRGNSYYWSAYYHPNWTTYNARWTSGDLPVQGTVKEARLYVMYNSDKGHLDAANLGVGNDYLVATNNITMCFNGDDNYPLNATYMDRKGWGSYDDPYGMLVYNVTDDFNTGGNTANLTNTYPCGGNLSIDGMVLMVIDEDASEPRRLIFVNEECDMINYKATGSYGTTPEEATAWAPISGSSIDMSNLSAAKLITLAPSGDGPEGDLIVNGKVYPEAWDFGSSASEIGVNECDVASDLNSTGNLVGFRANDSVKCVMRATNAFLVATLGAAKIAIDQPEFVDPQSQFTINITVDPGANKISAVQYDLYYNTSVVWAEWANPGSFLNRGGPTDVTVLSIDNTWNVPSHIGKISYAETTLGSGGTLPFVDTPGVLTTIHFSAIGERGTYSVMDIEDVLMSDQNKTPVVNLITDCGVTIYDNKDPVANGTSMYRFSNVASKFQCFAVLCPCLSTGGDDDWWGANITYVRWDFGDGQYGTSEGVDPCEVKMHEYTSWNWVSDSGHENGGYYENFTAYLTVRDDGEPQLSNTTAVPVMVYIAGDTNGDGVVNILDAACVGKHYKQTANSAPANCTHYWTDPQADEADLNNDNRVSTIDLMIVGTNWNHLAYPPYIQE